MHVWNTFTSLKFSFMLYTHELRVWAVVPLASAKKITFGFTVSCKWTRQLHHLDFLNPSFRLIWGIFRHSLTYVASLWGRNTTDTRTLHRINTICWAVARDGEYITRSVNSLTVTWRFRVVCLLLSLNIDPLSNFVASQWELHTFCPFWSDFPGENERNQEVVYPPPERTKTGNQFVCLSFGVDPLNWQSFIETSEMACSKTAWCSRGHTLKFLPPDISFLVF